MGRPNARPERYLILKKSNFFSIDTPEKSLSDEHEALDKESKAIEPWKKNALFPETANYYKQLERLIDHTSIYRKNGSWRT